MSHILNTLPGLRLPRPQALRPQVVSFEVPNGLIYIPPHSTGTSHFSITDSDVIPPAPSRPMPRHHPLAPESDTTWFGDYEAAEESAEDYYDTTEQSSEEDYDTAEESMEEDYETAEEDSSESLEEDYDSADDSIQEQEEYSELDLDERDNRGRGFWDEPATTMGSTGAQGSEGANREQGEPSSGRQDEEAANKDDEAKGRIDAAEIDEERTDLNGGASVGHPPSRHRSSGRELDGDTATMILWRDDQHSCLMYGGSV